MMVDALSLRGTMTATASGFFSCSYNLHQGSACVAHIDQACFSNSAEVNIEGASHRFYREGARYFAVESNDHVFACAERSARFFGLSFSLRIGETDYVWGTNFNLTQFRLLREGVEIGLAKPLDFLPRKALINLPKSLPKPTQVFLFWLASPMLWASGA
jgi:hypothetical protein